MQDEQHLTEAEVPENHIIFLSGEINLEMSTAVSQKLLEIDLTMKQYGVTTPITMVINSPGGDINAAWQICDIMDFIDCDIYTTGVGQIASAALMIFMNGTPGYRTVSDRTSIMSHRYSWGASGKQPDLISIQDEFKNTHERMISHYVECTGLSQKEIEEKLLCEHDIWLTGSQAMKLGLVDNCITSKKTKNLRKRKKVTNGRNPTRKPTK
jgi:ATP-dependent Clp protease protease subunit